MDSFEKKILIAMALLLMIFIGSCTWLSVALDNEFGECKGLQGAVDRVWTGEPCATEDQK